MNEETIGCLASIVLTVVILVCTIGMMAGFNSCSSHDWNEGICPDCEMRYELIGMSTD